MDEIEGVDATHEIPVLHVQPLENLHQEGDLLVVDPNEGGLVEARPITTGLGTWVRQRKRPISPSSSASPSGNPIRRKIVSKGPKTLGQQYRGGLFGFRSLHQIAQENIARKAKVGGGGAKSFSTNSCSTSSGEWSGKANSHTSARRRRANSKAHKSPRQPKGELVKR